MERDETYSASGDSASSDQETEFSLLLDSLRLTSWERFLENERALALVRMLEAAQPYGKGSVV